MPALAFLHVVAVKLLPIRVEYLKSGFVFSSLLAAVHRLSNDINANLVVF